MNQSEKKRVEEQKRIVEIIKLLLKDTGWEFVIEDEYNKSLALGNDNVDLFIYKKYLALREEREKVPQDKISSDSKEYYDDLEEYVNKQHLSQHYTLS